MASAAGSAASPIPANQAPAEPHLADLIQLTPTGENAEAYWSPDGKELTLQSHGAAESCDQIYRLAADGSKPPIRVSSGKGRTTCSYYLCGGERVIFSSTEASSPDCPPPPDRSHGYVWAVYPTYEIWSTKPDGSDPVRLTDNQAYDAESTVCPTDGRIVFTSDRDGDLELYSMNPDGTDVHRLTHTPGYDGGAFYSPDCTKLVWRAARPKPGKEQEEDAALLKQGLVRPGKLEIWVGNADGTEAHQVTALGAASFAPSFFPSGKRLLFSSNYGDPKGREFDIWAIDLDGTNLERITRSPGFDGFPLFSPDGKRLAFSSNRVQKAEGDTNVFVARWIDSPIVSEPTSPQSGADRFEADVRWLADDAREGRGVGTKGLAEAAAWIEQRFRDLGLEPGEGDGATATFRQDFDVPVSIESGAGTHASLDSHALDAESFRPLGFSASGSVKGEVVAAGYGVTATERGVDDYQGIDAKGKIVAVRRFVAPAAPAPERKEGEVETPAEREAREKATDLELRESDLRYKAWNAKQHGAIGLIVVDLPPPSQPIKPTAELPGQMPDEAPLPTLSVADAGDAGLPVIAVGRKAGASLFSTGSDRIQRAEIAVELVTKTERAANVVGVLRAKGTERFPGAVLIGAHYDHLGFGPFGSLDPDSKSPHNGADDNASGTAALLLAARTLAENRADLKRDVWFVAFSGEERGVLGSTFFTRRPPKGLALTDLDAMINMDMVGRLRENKLSVLGGESGEGWAALVDPACERAGLTCALSGDGYGPSDHSPFYAAGVPVLHLFTGTHSDYHRPSDDSDKINALGGAKVAGLAADVAQVVANRSERIAYKTAPAPPPSGDLRGSGASLGTIPDYAGDQRPGVLLAGVRVGSPAEKAGIGRGDLLVELAGTEIRDIQDFMFVLRRAVPGQRAPVVVVRDGRKVTLEVEFGVNTRMR